MYITNLDVSNIKDTLPNKLDKNKILFFGLCSNVSFGIKQNEYIDINFYFENGTFYMFRIYYTKKDFAFFYCDGTNYNQIW